MIKSNSLRIIGINGLVQMFFYDTNEAEGKLKARYVLNLEQNPNDEVIFLSHYIALTRLKGLYLADIESGERISRNLISPLRRIFVHSSFKEQLIAFGAGSVIISIFFALSDYFG